MSVLHRLDMIVEEEDFPLAEALVASHVSHGWEEASLPSGESRLRVHCEEKGVLAALEAEARLLLPSLSTVWGEAPEQNWMEAWREFFTPVEAGEFLVLPPWLAESPEAGSGRERGLHPVLIEPKSAFGTGHHPTTTLCLEALSRLHGAGIIRAGQSFLDLGTGTGVLGIGCVRLGLTGLGLDIDPLAVSNAAENRELNQVGEAFRIMPGSVDTVAGRRFDVVVANILAAPLREMAPSIMKLVRPGGCLILSGFLAVQTPALEAAYAAMGRASRLTAPSASPDPTRTAGQQEGGSGVDDWVCLSWPDAV